MEFSQELSRGSFWAWLGFSPVLITMVSFLPLPHSVQPSPWPQTGLAAGRGGVPSLGRVSRVGVVLWNT